MEQSFIQPPRDSRLSQLRIAISKRFGLRLPEEKERELGATLKELTHRLEYETEEALIDAFLSLKLTQDEEEEIISQLTVGETYFFRDEALLSILNNRLLPGLIERKREGTRTLRFWSAGCATGEEPYTLAIILKELLPDLTEWQVFIQGTDLNRASLRKAKAGIYRSWSFRNTPDRLKERYFSDKGDGNFGIIPEIRKMVRFAPLNLAQAQYPSELNNTRDLDIIFCRNVLMYFTKETIADALGRFYHCLGPEGWLVTAPCEALPSPNLFLPVSLGQGTVYRKSDPPLQPGTPALFPSGIDNIAPGEGTPRRSILLKGKSKPVKPRTGEPVPAKKQISLQPMDEGEATSPLKQAIAAADKGKLGEALELCRAGIEKDRLNPEGYYLLAQISQEQGDTSEAIAALKKTIYLDSEHAPAHFRLGLILAGLGRAGEAKRYLQSARTFLDKYPSEFIISPSEGITAGRLIAILADRLRQG